MNFVTTENLTLSKCHSLDFRGYFIVETVTLFIFSMIALPANIIFFYILHKTTLFHPNVLFCLKTFSFGNIIKTVYFLSNACYNIILVYNQGAIEISRFFCGAVHIPYWVASVGQSGTMCVIGIERLKATWYPNFNENELTRANWSVKFGTLFGHIAGIVSLAILFAGVTTNSDDTVCYCHVVLVGDYKAYIVLAFVYVPGQVLIVFILLLVYKGNLKGLEKFYLNTARLTLQKRFEMSANVKLTKMLLPAIISHSIVYSIIFASIPFSNYYFHKYTSMTFLNLAATPFVISIIDALANPILCVENSEHIKSIWWSLFSKNEDTSLLSKLDAFVRNLLSYAPRQRSSGFFVSYHVSSDQSNAIVDKFWATPTKNKNVFN